MLKHTLVAGILSLGFIISAPAMAHGQNDSQVIYPAHNHNHQPVRHCVSGHKVNQRLSNQRNRIDAGVQSGELVRWERAQLNQQQGNLHAQKKQMLRDGCLTTSEFDKLIRTLKWTSGQIRDLTTNNIRRSQHRNRHDRYDRSDRNHRNNRNNNH